MILWLASLTVAMASLAVVLGVHLARERVAVPQTGHDANEDKGPAIAVAAATEEKPWGTIECVPIVISPPLEFVSQSAQLGTEVVWRIPSTDVERLAKELAEIGLDRGTIERLNAAADRDSDIEGVVIRPDRETVVELTPEARGILYTFLAQFSQNSDQGDAFRFPTESLEGWFGEQTIPPDVAGLVEPLLYRRGRYLFFADLRIVDGQLSSQTTRSRLLQLLSRESTFLARVRITGASDVDKLTNYWCRGGRSKDVRPLLESLARLGGVQELDITHLLPPFARRRIYTYPSPQSLSDTAVRDCHWTSLNFFSEQPDDRFCSAEEVMRVVSTEYFRVFSNPQFGDIVMFVRSEGDAIHSAVYLADDILYTKNGSSSAHPWMLMKLEQLRDYYPSLRPLQIHYFRRKDI